MIVSKWAKAPRLRNEDDDTAATSLSISDDDGAAGGSERGTRNDAPPGSENGERIDRDPDAVDPDAPQDRGDVVHPEPSAKALQQLVAGEEGKAGQASDTQPGAGGNDTAAGAAGTDKASGKDTQAGAAGDDTIEGGEGGEGGGHRVPQARLNEVIAQRNAAQRALEEATAELARVKAAGTPPAATPTPTPAPPPAFDVKGKEREYAELLADGEFEKAADLRMEINDHIRQEAVATARAEFQQEAVAATLTTVATQAVKDFPYLDTEEGGPAMAAILHERARLERTGLEPAQALQQAVEKIAPKFGERAGAAPAATPAATPAPSSAPAAGNGAKANPPGKDSPTPASAGDTRPAVAAARGAQHSAQQPPTLAVAGKGNEPTSSGTDVRDLTEPQFEALSLEEKKRLRGDY